MENASAHPRRNFVLAAFSVLAAPLLAGDLDVLQIGRGRAATGAEIGVEEGHAVDVGLGLRLGDLAHDEHPPEPHHRRTFEDRDLEIVRHPHREVLHRDVHDARALDLLLEEPELRERGAHDDRVAHERAHRHEAANVEVREVQDGGHVKQKCCRARRRGYVGLR